MRRNSCTSSLARRAHRSAVSVVVTAILAGAAMAEEAPAFRETLLAGCTATVRANGWPEVGAPIRCEVRMDASGGSETRFDPGSLAIPTRPETLGVFDVLSISDARVETGRNGAVYAVFDVVLSTLDAGTQTPDPLTIAYLAGGTLREGRVEFPTFPVKSLLDGGDAPEAGATVDPTKYRDILGEIPILERIAWWGYTGAAAVLLLGAWLIWRLMRHDRREALEPNAWALAELDRLSRAGLSTSGEFGVFYDRLTAIVRAYAARRYAIPAERQTTREFLAEASAHNEFPAGETERLRALLGLADLVKFAAATPDRAECDAQLADARSFVERTRPAAASASNTEAST
ncbi:MAG: hypothetical protein ACKO3W_11010 [bacterium]